MAKDNYHHGDLRAALLKAGEEILGETGISGFSLRRVAREVGVSHSAPAHHFGDANGLLVALAAVGFRRFANAMRDRQSRIDFDPAERLIASGLGYIDFAKSSPALFRLMFGEKLSTINVENDELAAASEEAFEHLVKGVERLDGVSPHEDDRSMTRVMAIWSFAHGFAELLLSGRMVYVQSLPPEQQEEVFRQAMRPILA